MKPLGPFGRFVNHIQILPKRELSSAFVNVHRFCPDKNSAVSNSKDPPVKFGHEFRFDQPTDAQKLVIY